MYISPRKHLVDLIPEIPWFELGSCYLVALAISIYTVWYSQINKGPNQNHDRYSTCAIVIHQRYFSPLQLHTQAIDQPNERRSLFLNQAILRMSLL